MENNLAANRAPVQASMDSPSAGDTSAIASAWRSHADALTRWTQKRLVCRTDVWGAYLPLDKRGTVGANGQTLGNSYTAPAVKNRGQVKLEWWTIRNHFLGEVPEDVIGLHTISADNLSKSATIEIDHHGDGPVPQANWRAARNWYEQQVAQGFHPLLVDSDGKGGFHLRSPLQHGHPHAGRVRLAQAVRQQFCAFRTRQGP